MVSRPGLSVTALADRLPALAPRMTAPPSPPDTSSKTTMIFLIDVPTPDVSGTAIRTRREAGESIDGLVPPLVQQYIEQHGLYAAKTEGRRAGDATPPAAAGRLHGQN